MGSRRASPAAPASCAGDNNGADLRPNAGLVGLGRTTVCGPRLDEVRAPKGFCSGGKGADDEWRTAVCRGHGNGGRRTAAAAGGPDSGAGGSLFDGGVCPRATAAASAGSTAAAEAVTAAVFELQSLLSSTAAAAGWCAMPPPSGI